MPQPPQPPLPESSSPPATATTIPVSQTVQVPTITYSSFTQQDLAKQPQMLVETMSSPPSFPTQHHQNPINILLHSLAQNLEPTDVAQISNLESHSTESQISNLELFSDDESHLSIHMADLTASQAKPFVEEVIDESMDTEHVPPRAQYTPLHIPLAMVFPLKASQHLNGGIKSWK